MLCGPADVPLAPSNQFAEHWRELKTSVQTICKKIAKRY
jgi:hypothetical protein